MDVNHAMNATLALHGGRAELDGLPFPAWPRAAGGEADALRRVVQSNAWGSNAGAEVAAFEAEFAQAQGTTHATALVNGTLAITAALRAAGVGLGDEVIVPPYTFIATASAPLLIGAVPVFADVLPESHLLDPAAAEAAITERTKAIVVVHIAGNVADMDAFAEIGRRHGVAVIEDAAQAVGASWQGRGAGALGDLGTFSFQSSKNMTAGEGGIVTSQSAELDAAVYSFVNVGRVRGGGWYQHESVGYNLRLTEFQGAVLREQLRELADVQQLRDRNARTLDAALAAIDGVEIDTVDERVTAHGRHLHMLRVPGLGRAGRRDEAVAALEAEGVLVSPGYVPLQRNEPLVRDVAALCERLGQPVPRAACPQADVVSADTLWLPQRVLMGTDEQIDGVARAFAKVVAALS